MAVKLKADGIIDFVKESEIELAEPQVKLAMQLLKKAEQKEDNMVGWHTLPINFNSNDVDEILESAERIKRQADVFVVIGVGGSYLGARAAIELLKSQFYNYEHTPQIYFVGNNMSPSYLNHVLNMCKDKELCINVISKSGGTLEPALAFRAFKSLLETKYGKAEAKKRIFITTGAQKNSLLNLAEIEGYKTFKIPVNIGGRFSVLTPVGLLPMAVAGIDIQQIILGAKEAFEDLRSDNIAENDSMLYAAYRNCLYKKSRRIELFTSFEPDFEFFLKWCQQLFAESEGKSGNGIFPVPVIYSTDLHSIGQFVQESGQALFETFIDIENAEDEYIVEKELVDYDSLNFLADKKMSFINKMAFLGTVSAHTKGGVPCIILNMPKKNEREYGYLIYFLEKACAISGYMLGVNPFDQPGVEEYKTRMFRLLKGKQEE